MKKTVLDTYAIMTYLKNEPGVKEIENLLLDSERGKIELLVSCVNLCEIYYLIKRKEGFAKSRSIISALKSWPVTFVPASETESISAGDLKAHYRISLADSFAAGTAILNDCPLVTGDPEFVPLEKSGALKIHWL